MKAARASGPVAMRFRSSVRATLGRVLAVLSRRRGLVKLVKPLFVLMPSLKAWLQRIAAAAPPMAVHRVRLDDAQLRVLLDLRNAIERTSKNQ